MQWYFYNNYGLLSRGLSKIFSRQSAKIKIPVKFLVANQPVLFGLYFSLYFGLYFSNGLDMRFLVLPPCHSVDHGQFPCGFWNKSSQPLQNRWMKPDTANDNTCYFYFKQFFAKLPVMTRQNSPFASILGDYVLFSFNSQYAKLIERKPYERLLDGRNISAQDR